MSIHLRCLGCGHILDLADSYEDYDGHVRCWTCRALLTVSLREGRLRGMARAEETCAEPLGGEE
jgi:DNA-directed RNA polymerase subunit N (RpoN/RPB10)